MQRDAANQNITLRFDPKSGITDERVQGWIRDYYLPAIAKAKEWSGYDGTRQLTQVDFRPVAERGGNAWVLSEPKAQRALCLEIVGKIASPQARASAEALCWFAAAAYAEAPLYEFDGRSVSYDVKAGYGGKALKTDSRLWQRRADGRYDATVIVPGDGQILQPRWVHVQERLIADVKVESPYYQQLQKISSANKAWIEKQERAVAALEKKQGGASGDRVVFGERWFDDWDPVAAIATAASCESVFYKAFGPKGGRAHYLYIVKVDNQECDDGAVDSTSGLADRAWPVAVGGPVFTGRKNDCSKHLTAIGRHEIAVDLWTTKKYKTGEKRVLPNGAIEELEGTERDRSIASGKLSCQTADDHLRTWLAGAR
jgi:hypothetical protein